MIDDLELYESPGAVDGLCLNCMFILYLIEYLVIDVNKKKIISDVTFEQNFLKYLMNGVASKPFYDSDMNNDNFIF